MAIHYRALLMSVVLGLACSSKDDRDTGSGGMAQAGTMSGSGGIGGVSGASHDSGGAGGGNVGGESGSAGAMPSGGSGGESGGAGIAGGTGDGGAGMEAPPDDEACSPATQSYLDADTWQSAIEPCANQGLSPTNDTQLPNPSGISVVDEVLLDTPLPAGVASALSLQLNYADTAGTFELWGSSGDACGPVTELLWWTEIASRRFCAELTPSQEITRLLAVWREQEVLNGQFNFGTGEVSICASGTCPGTSSGHGRAPGTALHAPVGFYEVAGGDRLPFAAGGFQTFGMDGEGALVMRTGPPGQELEDPDPYASGVVRMPPFDPFGDAWYCLGAGSQRVQNEDEDNDEWTTLELRGLTRLDSCEGGAGTDTASITVDLDPTLAGEGTAQITASNGAFAMADAQVRGECRHLRCGFMFFVDGETPAPISTELFLELDTDVGTWSTPSLQEAQVISGSWIHSPAGTGPMAMACVAAGTVHYDPEGETTITLSGVTSTASCPGEAIDPNMLDIQLD